VDSASGFRPSDSGSISRLCGALCIISMGQPETILKTSHGVSDSIYVINKTILGAKLCELSPFKIIQTTLVHNRVYPGIDKTSFT